MEASATPIPIDVNVRETSQADFVKLMVKILNLSTSPALFQVLINLFFSIKVQITRINSIRVKNLGWYVAGLKLAYQVQNSLTGVKEYKEESSSIAALESYTFR